MSELESEVRPPAGEYRGTPLFVLCEFAYTASLHFSKRYLQSAHSLKKQVEKDASAALRTIADGLSTLGSPDRSGLTPADFLLLGSNALERLSKDLESFIAENGLRKFEPFSPVMIRFRKFRCRSLAAFRDWVSIERFDSDRAFEETPPGDCSGLVFFHSSAELAANALIVHIARCRMLLAGLVRRERTQGRARP